MPQARPHRRPQPRPPRRVEPSAPAQRGTWLTWLAFAVLAAVVVARMLMLETIRTAAPAIPGTPVPPAGPGPTSGLVLDLLACVPALLVLVRGWRDPTFALRLAWSTIPMGLLGIWAVLSVAWSTDKFATLVSSVHLLAAFASLWAAVQVVRTWLHLRLVAGVCCGLLLVLILHSIEYVALERPDLRERWAKDPEGMLRDQGKTPGTFEARQFENMVLHGELRGFSASPNTYAAAVVLTLVVTLGAIAGRWPRGGAADAGRPAAADSAGEDGETPAAADADAAAPVLPYARGRLPGVPPGVSQSPAVGRAVAAAGAVVLVGLALWMVFLAQSRTALATAFLAFALVGALAVGGRWLAGRSRLLYFAGVAAFAVGTVLIVGHGLRHGTLFHDSLNFRWRYWVGSARLFRLHPLAGVGWEHFGPPYLANRLPTATEEIKDPHNFLVRFAVELGLVGGGLAAAWMLRLWWELTLPVVATKDASPDAEDAGWRGRRGIVLVAVAALFAMVLNTAASLDFGQIDAFIITELFRRAVYLVALVVGVLAVGVRVTPEVRLDDRPAPWLLRAVVVGLAAFLVHNLIDFALFERGPMFLFALLAGSALGMRTPAGAPAAAGCRASGVALIAGMVAWLALLAVVVIPVGVAEVRADEGDALIHARRVEAGAESLERAFGGGWTNADYASRAARAWRMAGRPDRTRRMLDAAIAADPDVAGYWLSRGAFEMEQTPPVPDRAAADLAEAVRLDPNNLEDRLLYASVLERLGRRDDARAQYELTLKYNDRLTKEERRRLSAEKVDEVQRQIQAMER